jgi:ParB family chromosome partitioning protein
VDQLDDSPYQLRRGMDSDGLAELTRSIRDPGLLHPILVHQAEKMYQVISGHRRLAAYRRLQFAAKTEADKQKYAAIPARELNSVTDEQMLLLGLAENMFRADIRRSMPRLGW